MFRRDLNEYILRALEPYLENYNDDFYYRLIDEAYERYKKDAMAWLMKQVELEGRNDEPS